MKLPFKIDILKRGNYIASFDWIKVDVIFVRGGKNWSWGEPYEFTFLIETFKELCEIKGYMGTYNKEIRLLIRDYLRKIGIKKAEFERLGSNSRKIILKV